MLLCFPPWFAGVKSICSMRYATVVHRSPVLLFFPLYGTFFDLFSPLFLAASFFPCVESFPDRGNYPQDLYASFFRRGGPLSSTFVRLRASVSSFFYCQFFFLITFDLCQLGLIRQMLFQERRVAASSIRRAYRELSDSKPSLPFRAYLLGRKSPDIRGKLSPSSFRHFSFFDNSFLSY